MISRLHKISYTLVYIATASTAYDATPANILMFPGQAVRWLRKIKEKQPLAICRMLIFDAYTVYKKSTPYTPDQIKVVAKDLAGMNIPAPIMLKSNTSFFKYINEGVTSRGAVDLSRSQYKIKRLSIFSHGRPSRIAIGYDFLDAEVRYSIYGEDDPDLGKSPPPANYQNLSADAFAALSSFEVYGCRVGAPANYNETEKGDLINNLAQKLANHLDTRVIGLEVRSEFSFTWGVQWQISICSNLGHQSRPLDDYAESPPPNILGPALQYLFCEEILNQHATREGQEEEIGAMYIPGGALHPVVSSSGLPGLTKGFFMYRKGRNRSGSLPGYNSDSDPLLID